MPTPDPERVSEPARTPEPPRGAIETQLRPPRLRVHRRAIPWWTVRVLSSWGLLLALLIAPALIWPSARVWLLAPIALVTLVLLVKVVVEPRLRYAVHRWEITDTAAYVRSGWLVREWRVAPSSRIQTVDAVRGPLEQLFGLATLTVTTASAAGAVTIRGLDAETAQDAATRLAEIARVSRGDAT